MLKNIFWYKTLDIGYDKTYLGYYVAYFPFFVVLLPLKNNNTNNKHTLKWGKLIFRLILFYFTLSILYCQANAGNGSDTSYKLTRSSPYSYLQLSN